MAVETVKLGDLEVSRFILGGNPFSGFSHWNGKLDDEMRHYYTCEHIKAVYREAERLGITTHIGRADHHIIRVLMEHWDEGGQIQWIAQTCPELGTPERGALNGICNGAKACFMGDKTGTLEADKLADIIVVNGDPLSDITILQDSDKIELVMLEGNIEKKL